MRGASRTEHLMSSNPAYGAPTPNSGHQGQRLTRIYQTTMKFPAAQIADGIIKTVAPVLVEWGVAGSRACSTYIRQHDQGES
jgi:hypothetical protein